MVQNQVHTDSYSIYNGDCMEVLPTLPAKSVDLSVYSPPFAGLYNYSSSPNDMSNCATKEEFLQHYEFLVKEMARITKPGRINAVHCTDIFNHQGHLWDFPHEIIALHERNGFKYCSRISIWKEPLKVKTQTMVDSLKHKWIVEDSTRCWPAMPDYLLIFKRTGENEVPVKHEKGFRYYAGTTPVLPEMAEIYNRANDSNHTPESLWEYFKMKYKTVDNPYKSELSFTIWRRYASAFWDDIRVGNVLPYKESKDEDDEKHVHPLQLDVIDRCVELWSNPNEVILTPFMGVGSEVFSPVSLGRKAIGIELKESYFRQAVMNLESARVRPIDDQLSLF